jgi:hypothetical protein
VPKALLAALAAILPGVLGVIGLHRLGRFLASHGTAWLLLAAVAAGAWLVGAAVAAVGGRCARANVERLLGPRP